MPARERAWAVLGVVACVLLSACGDESSRPSQAEPAQPVPRTLTTPDARTARPTPPPTPTPRVQPPRLEYPNLVVGIVYQVSGATPLYQERNGSSVSELPPGSYFEVKSNRNGWYAAVVSDGVQEYNVWIDAASLNGQQVTDGFIYVSYADGVYHRGSCPQMKGGERAGSATAAVAGGYKACPRCKPPQPSQEAVELWKQQPPRPVTSIRTRLSDEEQEEQKKKANTRTIILYDQYR